MVEALIGFELTDALDIAIVAALLYASISWLRRTRAALAGLGIALVGTVYLTARTLGLDLTTTIFQGAFATLASSGARSAPPSWRASSIRTRPATTGR